MTHEHIKLTAELIGICAILFAMSTGIEVIILHFQNERARKNGTAEIPESAREMAVWRCVECMSCGILSSVPEGSYWDVFIESGLQHGIEHQRVTGHVVKFERRKHIYSYRASQFEVGKAIKAREMEANYVGMAGMQQAGAAFAQLFSDVGTRPAQTCFAVGCDNPVLRKFDLCESCAEKELL